MNRIDEIKERVRTYHYHNETEDVGDDIFYLLSNLEIAEKALEKIVLISTDNVESYVFGDAANDALDLIRAEVRKFKRYP